MSLSSDVSTRLIIVANRLPVTVVVDDDDVHVTPSSGGLVTGLRPWHERRDGVWVGWPGETSGLSAERRADVDRQLADHRFVPVHLSGDEVERCYHGFANRVLWPLFHYQVDRVPVDAGDWDAYRLVNERFAEAAWREYRPGDTIWIHDYQLMLVPGLLRVRLPHARIGFFLHIPFPSSEVFRVLPWRQQILDGLLGADLVGFHTFAYLRHFVNALLHIEGVEADVDRVHVTGRDVRLGAYPMGIDAQSFSALAIAPEVVAASEVIRRDAGGRRILLGVDSLDYTKGIPRRLHAIERLLARQPELADSIRYVQVAVPSRGEVDAYQKFKQQVEEFVGRINGAFGTLRSVPIHYVHHSVSSAELVALYRAADVMLVTPLRDGMNLVAKEFAASRVDEDGVLVLSEFAGAAVELDGAVVVNPYDVEALADTILHALSLPNAERRARMKTLRRQVTEHDVHDWAARFVRMLLEARPVDGMPAARPPGPSLAHAFETATAAAHVRLLLDYDGTLVPLARSPEAATPDEDLLELLEALTALPGTRVDIVSGRPREPLEAWFGHLPMALWAEHGFWYRPSPLHPWRTNANPPSNWQDRIRPMLEQFVASTPGSRIETKISSLVWHFRGAQRDHGIRQAHELRMMLGTAFSNQPWGVIEGKKTIEVRLRAADKAVVAARVASESESDTAVVAIGDERTDDDLFIALPESSIRVAVGRPSPHAPFVVQDYRGVRRLLRGLIAGRLPVVPAL
jgi:trehalose 6-phosphate synthase/phosphatase